MWCFSEPFLSSLVTPEISLHALDIDFEIGMPGGMVDSEMKKRFGELSLFCLVVKTRRTSSVSFHVGFNEESVWLRSVQGNLTD